MRNYLILLLLTLFLWGCKNPVNSFKKASSGLEYRFITENPEASAAKPDELLVITLDVLTENGDLLFSSRKSDRKYLKKLHEPAHPGGSLEDALAMMHLGDSAVFRVDAYNYYTYTEKLEKLPDKVKKGDKIILHIRLDEIISEGNYNDLLVEKYHKDEATELSLLADYLKRTNVTVKPTPSGLYYIELKKGSGVKPSPGQKVKVHYTGCFIDGSMFETSLTSRPIEFTLGNKEVIDGWDEGIALMQTGGKARLIIPSRIAYGALGKDEILPYSTLVFDV